MNRYWCILTLFSFCLFTRALYPSPPLPTVIEPRKGIHVESFTFGVVGDSRPTGVSGKQPEVFKKITEEINKSGAGFLIHLGDNIYGSKDVNAVKRQYAEYREVIGKLKVPVHVTVGNHEINGVRENENLHRELFGPLYYSFVYLNCFFIVIDTEIAGSEGAVKGEQLSWLRGELEKARGYRYLFVFLHRPLFSVLSPGKNYAHFSSREERDSLTSLFREYRVSAIFAGHEHLYDSSLHDGLRQVVSGGGGGPLHAYPVGGFHHFLLVEVTDRKATVRPVIVTVGK